MKLVELHLLIFLFSLSLVACSPGSSNAVAQLVADTPAGQRTALPSPDISAILTPTPTSSTTDEELQRQKSPDGTGTPIESDGEAPSETIIVPIAVYIIESQEEQFSSRRLPEKLAQTYMLVNEIWATAGITLDVRHVSRIDLPDSILEAIARGDFQPFFDGAGRDFDIPDPANINAFYAREIGGPNGIVPFGARLFFVADAPSVHDERVSSHEIGHILGLHHTLADTRRLMYPGTNGTALTDDEITVARYTAQGILDRLR